jgi:hypothetical protein
MHLPFRKFKRKRIVIQVVYCIFLAALFSLVGSLVIDFHWSNLTNRTFTLLVYWNGRHKRVHGERLKYV